MAKDILTNEPETEQHVFTQAVCHAFPKKKCTRFVENNVYCLFLWVGEEPIGVMNVFSLPLNVFRKSAICPCSEDLLAFTQAKLNVACRSLIEAHLSHCDFCHAELQLLERHRPPPERIAVTQIPIDLKHLAEYVLQQGGKARNRISPN